MIRRVNLFKKMIILSPNVLRKVVYCLPMDKGRRAAHAPVINVFNSRMKKILFHAITTESVSFKIQKWHKQHNSSPHDLCTIFPSLLNPQFKKLEFKGQNIHILDTFSRLTITESWVNHSLQLEFLKSQFIWITKLLWNEGQCIDKLCSVWVWFEHDVSLFTTCFKFSINKVVAYGWWVGMVFVALCKTIWAIEKRHLFSGFSVCC